MLVKTRPARTGDAEGACGVLRESIRHCCVEDHRNDTHILDAWLSNKTSQHVRAWFESPSLFSAVATDGAAISGVGSITRQGRIVIFYVAPEARHASVGDALLRTIEAQALAWGICLLQIRSTNSAKRFFVRRGFHEVGKGKFPFGANAFVLSKRLCASYPSGLARGCGRPFSASVANDERLGRALATETSAEPH